MKRVNYLLPEKAYMEKLLNIIDVITKKINKLKKKLVKGLNNGFFDQYIERMQLLNIGRYLVR